MTVQTKTETTAVIEAKGAADITVCAKKGSKYIGINQDSCTTYELYINEEQIRDLVKILTYYLDNREIESYKEEKVVEYEPNRL